MLVGFCVLGEHKTLDQGRFFPEGVGVTYKKIGSKTIFLYGYGQEYKAPMEERTYSLYPGGLDRRNIHVRIASDLVEIKTDWLGSFTCYYDEITKEVASHWGMLDLQSRDTDPVGSYTLKKYSFIPTSRTLKSSVKRVLSNQTLIWRPNDIVCVTNTSGISLEASTQTVDVIQHIAARLKKDGLNSSGVIIPLSGGYDSRFLASIVKGELNRAFRSFTYSLLGSSGDCFESKVSKVVAKRLNSPWRSFDLTGYSRYEQAIIDWDGGFSHVNGDYYEMFAEKVAQNQGSKLEPRLLVVSGIVGDAWCGKTLIPYHSGIKPRNVLLNHGIGTYAWLINTTEEEVSKQAEDELNEFFEKRIESTETILLELVRAKVALLSFLCYSFEKRGIRCSAPFLDKTVVQAVLSLDSEKRLNRKWQQEYFKKIGISDNKLPSVLLKTNRLAVNEGLKKKFAGYKALDLSKSKVLLLKLIFSEPVRLLEWALTSHKITEYILRKLGYKRTDVLISILNVLTK